LFRCNKIENIGRKTTGFFLKGITVCIPDNGVGNRLRIDSEIDGQVRSCLASEQTLNLSSIPEPKSKSFIPDF
jgi:hypothetical protein